VETIFAPGSSDSIRGSVFLNGLTADGRAQLFVAWFLALLSITTFWTFLREFSPFSHAGI